MSNIKYLHIIPNDKFNKEFIQFINKNFDKKEQFFLLITVPSSKGYKIDENKEENILEYKFKTSKNKIFKNFSFIIQTIKFYKILYSFSKKSNKVFFHGISNNQIIFLYLFRHILKKSYYIIWSTEKNRHEDRFIFNRIIKYVKGNFKAYITLMKGDFDLIKEWYNAKGELYKSFTYPSNFYKEIELKSNLEKKELYVQVGNSAQECNNHLEIFEKIKKFKDENIKLICPLSYGASIDEQQNIEKKGKAIFGNKFVSITEFMSYPEYLKLLSDIDIAIFAHDMQKAFGNITSLLSMKKTVYIKEKISTFSTLTEIGVKLKSFDSLNKLETFNEEILEKNKEIMKKFFSEEELVRQWNIIFDS